MGEYRVAKKMPVPQVTSRPILVQLDRQAMHRAALEGVRRRLDGLFESSKPAHGAKRNGRTLWDQDINATAAELAVAHYLDEPWTGEGNQHALADVGQCFQVRWTPYDDGCLTVHKTDSPDHFYVLVTGWDGQYSLRGWVAGTQAQVPTWWRYLKDSRRPAYFVPQHAPLGPMEELISG